MSKVYLSAHRSLYMLVVGLLFLVGFGCSSEPAEEDNSVIVTFSNATPSPIEVFWVNADVEELDIALDPGAGEDFIALPSQIWRFKQDGQVIGSYEAGEDLRQFHLIQVADDTEVVRNVTDEVATDAPGPAPVDPSPATITPLKSNDFAPTFDDPNIEFLPDGFRLPNGVLTMWSKKALYDLDASSEFVFEFDATLTEAWQEIIIAFSENRIPWGAEGADALTFRVSAETQDIWFRTGFYENWLYTRLFYNSSQEVALVGQKQRYRIRLTPSDISVSVDGKDIASADFDVAPVPRKGHVGFVIYGNPDVENAPITYQNIAYSKKARQRDLTFASGSTNEVQGGTSGGGEGRYRALVIAAEDYIDPSVNDLDFPLQDAGRIVETLKNSYTFDAENVHFLQNATQADIINALDGLRKEVQPEDNLLIFYAGHGYWDEQMEQGFWLPIDAEKDFRSKWLPNSTLRNYLRAIKARHTLLISDACFSGGIFKTRDAFGNVEAAIAELHKLPSRKAMTSGTLKEVPDKSVFVDFLIKRLQGNDQPFLTAQNLFNSLRDPVINNSPLRQIPQFGVVRETGDEGGEFVFQLRRSG